MDKDEKVTLIEVATDVRWIKQQREEDDRFVQKSLDEIVAHLATLNGSVAEVVKQAAINKSNIFRIWWFVGLTFTPFVAVALRVFGIF